MMWYIEMKNDPFWDRKVNEDLVVDWCGPADGAKFEFKAMGWFTCDGPIETHSIQHAR